MIIRVPFFLLALGLLTACAPPVPDSSPRGVGFDNSLEAQRERDLALARGATRVPDTVIPPAPGVSTATLDGSPEATAAETRRILAATRPGAGLEAPPATAVAPAPAPQDSTGISDENDFDAVAGRQTIESDAARIARNRAQYEVVQPEALPSRTGSEEPNIAAFALRTTNARGQQLYSRSGFNGRAKYERNCAEYPSSDQAQIDFLSRGGPERDRKGLDPDGDGFACSWDPAPFRKAAQN